MYAALDEANVAVQNNDVPIGAVIVHKDSIIARGHNTKELNNLATGHAEITVIERACQFLSSWRLTDCDIYVTVEPCVMCGGAIINARIKNLYFGTRDSKSGAFGSVLDINSLGLNHRIRVYNGILEYECRKIMVDFFKRLRLGSQSLLKNSLSSDFMRNPLVIHEPMF